MNGAMAPEIHEEVLFMNCNSNGLCGIGGDNWWWIIILVLIFCCGNNNGCCCDNNCGCC